ncbi:toluene monooxygenase system protein D [Nocardia transvalensis]|uniref:Toluene monooxygenase system protein D n=1 Tax=Nocardia transvalensis TaxID=37333 RepID=A0A7W9PJ83_9NOCA|nr:MmoB/DmpM family protein [Nocardia transvalensis]MBB5916619.1 toluene monooxygenase system protein D [Nocardia transvalensis]
MSVVGPILRMGDHVEEVIAAIRDDNPTQDIAVVDRGSYIRVQGHDRIRLTENTLRAYLGADYEIRSFGTMMSSFVGRVITNSDEIVWESIKRPTSEGALAP